MRSIVLAAVLYLTCSQGRAQNDIVFPNVWASAIEVWPCMDGVYGLIYHEQNYTFEMFQPIVEDGLEWGSLLVESTEVGRIAVDDQRVMFRRIGSYLSYLVPPDSIVELYDFDLAVGDTAYADVDTFDPYAVVNQIDTVYFNGRPRKRLLISNGDQWIQGIGSNQGLFRPLWTDLGECSVPEYSFCGECIDTAQQFYAFCDDMLTGVAVSDKPTLRAFPVPNNGSFTLEGGTPGDPYKIFDVCGRVVSTGRLTSGRQDFDLSSSTSGFCTLLVDDKRITLAIER